MGQPTPDGLNPVASLTERYGDALAALEYITEESDLPEDYVFVSVIHGDLYLCEVAEPSDAYWQITADIGPGKVGAWNTAADRVAKTLQDDYVILHIIGQEDGWFLAASATE